jgi:hypothetical protein
MRRRTLRSNPCLHCAAARHQKTAMALADPWHYGDDDTDLDHYDTAAGNIWRPDTQPRHEPAGPDPGSQAPRQPSPAATCSGPEPTVRKGPRK